MLRDRATGQDREVDVTLETELGGHTLVVSIEATTRKRPVDAKWVEGEIAKHDCLPTNKLVLVSESGFTRSARKKIEDQEGKVVALSPEEIESDPDRVIVSRLGIVAAKTVKIWPPRETTILIETPEGEIARARMDEQDDPVIFGPDGAEIGALSAEIQRRLNPIANDLIDRAGISNEPQHLDTNYRIGFHNWGYEIGATDNEDREDSHGFLRWSSEDGEEAEYTRITEVLITGRIEFEVVHISLTHMKLGQAATAFGDAALGEGKGLLVVTEETPGKALASLRTPDGYFADLTLDDELKQYPAG